MEIYNTFTEWENSFPYTDRNFKYEIADRYTWDDVSIYRQVSKQIYISTRNFRKKVTHTRTGKSYFGYN